MPVLSVNGSIIAPEFCEVNGGDIFEPRVDDCVGSGKLDSEGKTWCESLLRWKTFVLACPPRQY